MSYEEEDSHLLTVEWRGVAWGYSSGIISSDCYHMCGPPPSPAHLHSTCLVKLCTYVCMYVYTCVHMFACMCIHLHVCGPPPSPHPLLPHPPLAQIYSTLHVQACMYILALKKKNLPMSVLTSWRTARAVSRSRSLSRT